MPNISSVTDTWTDVGTTYVAIGMDVTDTASAAGSKLMDLEVGSTSKFIVHKSGSVLIAEQASAAADIAGFGQVWVKNTTPSELWYTDDAGTDTQLGVGGSPGGSDTEIQFNNSGAFGASANLTWDGTDLVLASTAALRGSYGPGGVTSNFVAGDGAGAAIVANTDVLCIGKDAGNISTANTGIFIGTNANPGSAGDGGLVVIGKDAAARGNGIAIGLNAYCGHKWGLSIGTDSNNDSYGVSLGYSADSAVAGISVGSRAGVLGHHAGSIVIGYYNGSTAGNQFVCGGATYPTDDWYGGKGVVNATPTNYTIHGTGGSGTDIAGADITIAGGQGTGTGATGEVVLQTAPSGGSGSSANALADVAKFDADTTAGNTRFLLYDVDTGSVVRVSVGANDSGGAGYKVLRIPN